ncbi:phage holin family protein [Naumannella halotolerans]|uniref:Putative superfamily III holin-X n=1 Tax=Naumannella halotolerans TaxID=993414 RepID=A0A4R7J7U2_9ACTN|nr:phage holin family protein [Naumannella halotolerans]TDT33530.1 putative superfamily III holin-X [Naumannella halotolerans]
MSQHPAQPPQPAGKDRGALQAADGRSVGEVMGDIAGDVSKLMRQEIALAKAEAQQSVTKVGKGVGMFVGAAIAGLLLLVFLSVSAWWGLGQFIGNQWSALIVALIWAVIAGVLALAGRAELQRIRGLSGTTETLSKIPNAVKGHEEDNR